MTDAKKTLRTTITSLNQYDRHYAVYGFVQRSTHLIDKVTGELVELSQADKTVLFYMVDKISYYTSEGRVMNESLPYIANELCLNDRTVSRCVQKLVKHHVLIASVVSKATGWVYTDVNLDQKYHKEVSANAVARAQPNPIASQATKDYVAAKQTPVVEDVVHQSKPVVSTSTSAPWAFADTIPYDAMPAHLNAPEFDYSDVVSQMMNTDYEPRVSVEFADAGQGFDYGDDEKYFLEQQVYTYNQESAIDSYSRF